MTASTEQRRRWRREFLQQTYAAAEGNPMTRLHMDSIGSQMNLGREDTQMTASYLVDEGLLEWAGLGGFMKITHAGIKAVEDEPPVQITDADASGAGGEDRYVIILTPRSTPNSSG